MGVTTHSQRFKTSATFWQVADLLFVIIVFTWTFQVPLGMSIANAPATQRDRAFLTVATVFAAWHVGSSSCRAPVRALLDLEQLVTRASSNLSMSARNTLAIDQASCRCLFLDQRESSPIGAASGASAEGNCCAVVGPALLNPVRNPVVTTIPHKVCALSTAGSPSG